MLFRSTGAVDHHGDVGRHGAIGADEEGTHTVALLVVPRGVHRHRPRARFGGGGRAFRAGRGGYGRWCRRGGHGRRRRPRDSGRCCGGSLQRPPGEDTGAHHERQCQHGGHHRRPTTCRLGPLRRWNRPAGSRGWRHVHTRRVPSAHVLRKLGMISLSPLFSSGADTFAPRMCRMSARSPQRADWHFWASPPANPYPYDPAE